MTDSWFVFNNTGKFLFKTGDFSRTKNIPESYNVTYIIKNPPGYNPLQDQNISYNIETNVVEFVELTLETLDSLDIDVTEEDRNIIDNSSLLLEISENKQKIDTLTSTIAALTTRINEMETNLNNVSQTFGNIFPI